jgi:hypothetical protein
MAAAWDETTLVRTEDEDEDEEESKMMVSGKWL